MKRKYIVGILGTVLLLVGCQQKAVQSEVTENTANQVTLDTQAIESQEPQKEPIEQALEELKEQVDENTLAVMITDPKLEAYPIFRKESQEIFVEGTEMTEDALVLVPLTDQAHIQINTMVWNDELMDLVVEETLYDFESQKGEVYLLALHVCEGIPNIQIVIEANGQKAYWENIYNGREDIGMDYINAL